MQGAGQADAGTPEFAPFELPKGLDRVCDEGRAAARRKRLGITGSGGCAAARAVIIRKNESV